jgi:AAA+ ATPase superfamily predicted ATPase
MFIGRIQELNTLNEFKKRQIAGLAVVYGRRRVGKSTLIEHFAENNRFLEFYGLSPRQCISNEDQLRHFGRQLGQSFNVPAMQFSNWFDALSTLAGLTKQGKYIILLDEISWMAAYDKDFPGVLKGIWDTQFKKNPQLLLILCGSVSSWIEDKILKNKGYVGRVSLQIKLEEMSLSDANQFWCGNENISAMEKFKLLCVTGGIPRYLEEINIKLSAEENIKRLCYQPQGLLFNEFESIFLDIFGKQSDKYRQIVEALLNGALEQSALSEILKISQSGLFSDQLDALESAGFIRRDFVWSLNAKKSTTSKYRLRDNYLRFYLKYIKPSRALIEQNIYHEVYLENLPHWQTIMGLQFENLVLNNLPVIIQKLRIAPETIISAAPYFQNKTSRQQAVQIDLLIHTKYTLYIVEVKFRQKIESTIITETIEKIKRLKIPNHLSVRPVLIYQGNLSETVVKSNYFAHLLMFSDFLEDIPKAFGF